MNDHMRDDLFILFSFRLCRDIDEDTISVGGFTRFYSIVYSFDASAEVDWRPVPLITSMTYP